MFRIDTRNATADGKFQEYPATILSPEWLNSVQEELAHAIEDAGIRLDQENKANHSQLLQAVRSSIVVPRLDTITHDIDHPLTLEALLRGIIPNDPANEWDWQGFFAEVILRRNHQSSDQKFFTKKTLTYNDMIRPHEEQILAQEYCFSCGVSHNAAALLHCFVNNGINPAPIRLIKRVKGWRLPHA